jgi:hypothetical protein
MEKNSEGIAQLESAISSFREQKCWSVIAGAGSGSLITLAFGRKVRRTRSLRNQHLTEVQRDFEGELELYVECAWRLETTTSVICTSTSNNEHGGTMLGGLEKLIGTTIVEAKLTHPAMDIKIAFDNGLTLVVFADQANEADKYCNYTVSEKSKIIINGAKSEISVLARPLPYADPEPE